MAKKRYEKCELEVVIVSFNEILTDIITNSNETRDSFDPAWAKGERQ